MSGKIDEDSFTAGENFFKTFEGVFNVKVMVGLRKDDKSGNKDWFFAGQVG